MANEILINVNVSGEENLNNVNTGLENVGKVTNKTTNALSALRKEMKDAKATMLSTAEGSDEYNNAMKRAAASADKLRDIQDKVKASQKDIGVIAKNVGGAVQGLGGAFSTVQGIIGLFGVESDKVTQTILKMQSVLNITQGITNFMDAFDNMKDLYNAVKLNILGLIATKQKETVATVANTAANVAEAGAITAVGTASKVTAKTIISALGPGALVMTAIAAVTTGIIKLITKINEVPRDLKIKMDLQENINKEVGDKMTSVYNKVITFAIDYNNAVKNGNKEHIKDLDEIGKKEFGLNKTRLEMISKNKDNWREAFDEYLKMAKLTYEKEALIKSVAETSTEIDVQQRTAQEYFSKRRNAYQKIVEKFGISRAESFANNEWEHNIGKITDSTLREYAKADEMYDDTINELNNSYDVLEIRQKALDWFIGRNSKYFKSSGTSGTGGGGKSSSSKPTIKSDKELKSELEAEGINEQNERRKEELRQEIIFTTRNKLDKVNIGKYKPLDTTASTESNMSVEDKGNELLNKVININEQIDQTLQETTDNTDRLFQRKLDNIQTYLNSFGDLTSSISDLYYSQMDVVDARYNKEKDEIELLNITEEERTKLLEENEKKRYEEKKKAFDKMKAFEIASSWIQFASGVISIWKGGYKELGPVAGPIIAGIETAALLATTIAQTKSIASQTMENPSSGTDTTVSTQSIAAYTGLNPDKTAMISKEENLNTINGKNKQINIVKVSDINNVQKSVNVRESNSSY